MKLAITGKGGVGKTTLTSLMAYTYAARGDTVMAIDADPSPCLGPALGFPPDQLKSISPIAEKLGISLDKVHIVLNRSNSNVGIETQEIERSFKHRVQFSIVSGGRPVVMSGNKGQPLLTGKLDNAVAQEIIRIGDWIIKNTPKN